MKLSDKLWWIFIVLEMAFLFPHSQLSHGFHEPGGQGYQQLVENQYHFSSGDIHFISGFEIPEEWSEKEEEENPGGENIKSNLSFLWFNPGWNDSDHVFQRLSIFSESHEFTSFTSLYLLYCCLKTCHVV